MSFKNFQRLYFEINFLSKLKLNFILKKIILKIIIGDLKNNQMHKTKIWETAWRNVRPNLT